MVVVKGTAAVTKQLLLGLVHIFPEKRQLLKAADGGLIGFLMPFTIVLGHFRNAVVCLDFHRREFLQQFHRFLLIDAKRPGRRQTSAGPLSQFTARLDAA